MVGQLDSDLNRSRAKILLLFTHIGGHRWLHAAMMLQSLRECGLKVSLGISSVVPADDPVEYRRLTEVLNNFLNTEIFFLSSNPSKRSKYHQELENLVASNHLSGVFFGDGEAHLGFLSDQKAGLIPRLTVPTSAYFFDFSFAQRRFRPISFRSNSVKAFFSDARWVNSLNSAVVTDLRTRLHRPDRIRRVFEISGNNIIPGTLASWFQINILRELEEFTKGSVAHKQIWILGNRWHRKNVEPLLQMMRSDPDLILIDIGENRALEKPSSEYKLLRESGRIFSKDAFVDFPSVKPLVEKTPAAIIPYEDFQRSSGLAAAWLQMGVPLIVPRGSQVGDWVEEFNLGFTFRRNEVSELTSLYKKATAQMERLRRNVRFFNQTFSSNPFEIFCEDVRRVASVTS